MVWARSAARVLGALGADADADVNGAGRQRRIAHRQAVILPRAFHDPALEVARLVGCRACVRGVATGSSWVRGLIGGPTQRRAAGSDAPRAPPQPASFAYVMNWDAHLANAVSRAGHPRRLIQPWTRWRARVDAPSSRAGRGGLDRHSPCPSCVGAGNLTRALGIGAPHNRLDLTSGRLVIEDHGLDPGAVQWGPRIGIRVGADRPWRAFVAGHPAVSGRARPTTNRASHETAAAPRDRRRPWPRQTGSCGPSN
jgi:hypothetical protein